MTKTSPSSSSSSRPASQVESILACLAAIWQNFLFLLFTPLWAQQRLVSSHINSKSTVFSTSARQPLGEIWTDFYPGKPRWRPERDMPDQSGRVAIVTGGAGGIGYECTRGLVRKGARVYVAARPHRRTAESLERLRKEAAHWPGEVKLLACDLSDMASVQSAVDEFARQESALDMLICNAGVYGPDEKLRSAQGYELTLATNVIGHHQIVRALLPLLRKSTKTSPARVCIISSWVHNLHQAAGFDTDDPEWQNGVSFNLLPGTQRIHIHPTGFWKAALFYGHSKFLNVLQAKKYQRLFGNSPDGKDKGGIVFTSCDPGNNTTALLHRDNFFVDLLWNWVVVPLILNHPSHGAISPLWACTASETAILGGQYLAPWARISFAAAPTEEHDVQDRLYAWSEQQLKKHGFEVDD